MPKPYPEKRDMVLADKEFTTDYIQRISVYHSHRQAVSSYKSGLVISVLPLKLEL